MLEKSKYLDRFKVAPPEFELLGDALLVEKIAPAEIRTKSGIVIAETKQYKMNLGDKKMTFVRVLAVGKGYYDPETGESVPLDTPVGAILMIAPESITFYSSFGNLENYEPDTIGLTRESSALIRFREGDEGYAKVFGLFNQAPS